MNKQLKMGIKVEMEHAPSFKFIKQFFKKHGVMPANKIIAKHIAGDHLREKKNYYTIVKKNKL